jgi:ATP-dependent RNA helicase SUPV3L1/SUV3
VPIDPSFAAALYRVVGYRLAGTRAVRIDILERLADLIRPLIAWRPTGDAVAQPAGAVAGNGFTVTVAMTSLLGCSGEDFASVLRSLGYRLDRQEAAPAGQSEVAAPATEKPPGEAPAQSAPAGTDNDFEPSAATGDAPEDARVAPANPTAEPADAAMEPTAAAPASAVEPAYVEVWRVGRRPRPDAKRNAANGDNRRPKRRPDKRKRGSNSHAGGPAADAQQVSGRRVGRDPATPRPASHHKPQRPERAVDPDSPFAALAALKDELEGRKSND